MNVSSRIRPLAIYLPQFHPIPENDKAWGKGFTEWTNVVKARPRFKGHYQPHLPADLGFYDLRVDEVRIAQAEMAKNSGIYGFCYYHYWFNGKRLLHRPLDDMIATKTPDFPFMLCWANENWTRRWNGLDQDVIIAQEYELQDHIKHITFLCDTMFCDDRYIKVDGKPVFAVYRTELIPDVERMAELWRKEARQRGFADLYLIAVEGVREAVDPTTLGFDACMDFQPNWRKLPPRIKPSFWKKVAGKLRLGNSLALTRDKVYDYSQLMTNALSQAPVHYKRYSCVVPMWDNSARRTVNAAIFVNSTPEAYGDWLYQTIKSFVPYSADENFVFINAWNEWAEGNHLEPCQKWGNSYLEATKAAIGRATQTRQ
jgi:lipopolysaccharide biosynthesis protein